MDNKSAAVEFNVNLDKVAKKLNLELATLFRALAARLFENIVRRTPVGDADYWQGHPKGTPSGNAKPPPGYIGGNARNNWWLSRNEKNNSPRGRSPGLGGVEALAGIELGTATAELGDVLHFQNGVPYIMKLESGTGSPRQAPHGMVAITLAEAETFYENLAAEAMAKT